MRCSSFHTKSHTMQVPHLYRQVQAQLSQWINPEDKRHLQVFCENIAAILQAQSACLSICVAFLRMRFFYNLTCNTDKISLTGALCASNFSILSNSRFGIYLHFLTRLTPSFQNS